MAQRGFLIGSVCSAMGRISPLISFRNWLSTIKWITLSLTRLPSVAENWGEVLVYFVLPIRKDPLSLRMRLGYVLEFPREYTYQAIAEVTILNVYNLEPCPGQVIVDIGASIGDFSAFAAKLGAGQVFAFEPDVKAYGGLVRNVQANRFSIVTARNAAADGSTIPQVLSSATDNFVDFLKIDCEGCEMGVLLGADAESLARVGSIHMETHAWVPGYSLDRIIDRLQQSGFEVIESTGRKPHYLHATRARRITNRASSGKATRVVSYEKDQHSDARNPNGMFS